MYPVVPPYSAKLHNKCEPKMGLLPLEFSECLTDSPHFREKLHAHEKELERTSKAIKGLVQECKDLIQAAKNLSKAQRSFSHNLMQFKFECIGSDQTEDEQVIENSLKEFGKLIKNIEDERDRMLDKAFETVIKPLEGFRKEQIGAAKDEKKKFEKQTGKYCQFMERYLALKNKTPTLEDEDNKVQFERQNFYKASMEYVLVLQEVQERKKFEFVETLLVFMLSWLTFYHQGYEASRDFTPYKQDLQSKLQKCRDNFELTRDQAKQLKNKMLEVRGTKLTAEHKAVGSGTQEGYLYMMEKKAIAGTSWSKMYCKYWKENRVLQMIPYNQTTGKGMSGITTDTSVLQSCTRRASDSIDRRFCFDITLHERPMTITLQALSEEDMQQWLTAMDGKEPIYTQPTNTKESDRLLDDIGFQFIKHCIEAIEKRGLEEQGLYRVVGVSSKVAKLTNMGLDKRRCGKIDFNDPDEWETKTVTSALKNYFRTLPEPLMRFQYHHDFVAAAKQGAKTLRLTDIHTLVHKLPQENFEMLKVLVLHLKNVAECSHKNLMTVPNLGVCFGPTLLRPPEETMASIMDIKWCNIVVEVLIYNYEKIFHTPPDGAEFSDSKVLSTSTVIPANSLGSHGNNQPSTGHHRSNSDCVQAAGQVNTTNLSVLSNSARFSYIDGVNDNDIEGSTEQGAESTKRSTTPPAYQNMNDSQTYAQIRAKLRPTTGFYGQYSPVWSSYSSSLGDHNSSRSSSSESLNSRSSHNAQHQSPVLNSHHQGDSRKSTSTNAPQVAGRFSQPSQSTASSGSKDTGSPAVPPRCQHKKRRSADSLSSTSSVSSASSRPLRRVRTLYACEAENSSELSFEPNEIIHNVKQSREPGWLEGTLKGTFGLIPANYVEYID